MGLLGASDISEHRVDINEAGKVKHFIYNRENRKAASTYNHSGDKYWTRNFLNFIEPITTDWEKDYSVVMCDGYEWYCILKYDDGIGLPPIFGPVSKLVRTVFMRPFAFHLIQA